jgi:hypothetical protein
MRIGRIHRHPRADPTTNTTDPGKINARARRKLVVKVPRHGHAQKVLRARHERLLVVTDEIRTCLVAETLNQDLGELVVAQNKKHTTQKTFNGGDRAKMPGRLVLDTTMETLKRSKCAIIELIGRDAVVEDLEGPWAYLLPKVLCRNVGSYAFGLRMTWLPTTRNITVHSNGVAEKDTVPDLYPKARLPIFTLRV